MLASFCEEILVSNFGNECTMPVVDCAPIPRPGLLTQLGKLSVKESKVLLTILSSPMAKALQLHPSFSPPPVVTTPLQPQTQTRLTRTPSSLSTSSSLMALLLHCVSPCDGAVLTSCSCLPVEAPCLVEHHLGHLPAPQLLLGGTGGKGELLSWVTLAYVSGVQLLHAWRPLHQGQAPEAVLPLPQDHPGACSAVAGSPSRDRVVEDGEGGVGDAPTTQPLRHELTLHLHREVAALGGSKQKSQSKKCICHLSHAKS